MKIRIILLYLIFKFNIIYQVFPLNKEVTNSVTSLFVMQNNDSIIFKYEKVKKLYEQENYTESLETALNLLKESKFLSPKELLNVNFVIGKIFYNTNDYKNSLNYFKKVLRIYNAEKEFKNEIDISDTDLLLNKEWHLIYSESLLNIGTSLLKINFDKNESEIDSSLYYYKKITDNNFNFKDFKLLKAKAYNNISLIHIQDSLYDLAKKNVLQSIEIHKSFNNKISQASALGNLSSIYLLENNFEKAKQIYFDAIDLIKDIKTDKALEVREDLYYNLAYNLYKLKDYTAYDYQELSYLIKDSIRDKQFRTIIAEINEKYNFDVKKGLILQEEENKRLRDQRTFWIIGIVAILVIFSLLYWLNYFKLKQKNLGLELSQTQLIQNQKIEKIKSESQIRILNATIDGKESERKQIAETLHDSVSALLSSANLHLQATKSQFNGKTPIEIEKTRSIITEASHKIRDLSHTLVSSVLLKFGLEFAINDMATKYSNSQIEVNTAISGVRRYHQSFEIKVYNIIQEFVNNILKHSQASIAKINLREEYKILYFEISDNGVGFDQTKISDKDGLGINQIEARITVMKGKFTIDSSVGKGTKIRVEIPVLEKEITNLV